ncbi:MAG TPA: hypothetical protein VFX52_16600 [Nocardioidaceae bacterium]|jgi:hypothetical protein|nr:hypothetical protein [Nocardioidaceae bacterium]
MTTRTTTSPTTGSTSLTSSFLSAVAAVWADTRYASRRVLELQIGVDR